MEHAGIHISFRARSGSLVLGLGFAIAIETGVLQLWLAPHHPVLAWIFLLSSSWMLGWLAMTTTRWAMERLASTSMQLTCALDAASNAERAPDARHAGCLTLGESSLRSHSV
jgi:hypothetical protein